jgi:hypothetical protein
MTGQAAPHPAWERAQARLREACASLCPEPRLEAAAEMLAPLVEWTGAARGSILALNPATGRLTIVAAVGLPENLLGQEMAPRPRSISEWVLRNRRGLILNGEVRDQRFESSAASDRIESALSLPLVAADIPIGVLNLARVSPAPVFAEAVLPALEPHLVPVAEALARLSLARETLRAGARLTRRSTGSGSPLLPVGRSEPRCYELALTHRASAVPAGDLCERVAHAGGDQSLIVLDPPGLGGIAAATAAFVQGAFVTLAAPERSAAGMAARLGAEVHQRLGPLHATAAWVAQLSTRGEVSYCNAGHASPLWLPADGGEVCHLGCGGPPLGALPAARYEEESLRLLPGDVVLVASDGLLGARGLTDHSFGSEGLAELLASLRGMPLERLVDSVLAAAVDYSGRPVPIDDLTVLALRYRPRG